MIEVNNIVSVQQIMKIVDNKTGEISYLIVDEDNQEWKQLSKEEYKQIRGI